MTTIVIGAGVIGVTTAYYLAKAGHEVTVVERHAEAACESSHANAGLIAVGHPAPWASPRAPLALLNSLWRADSALTFRPRLDPRQWAWCLRFLANCTSGRHRTNALRVLGLGAYSLEALTALRAETGIAYDEAARGILYLYRDAAHLAEAAATLRLVGEGRLGFEVKDAAECAGIEPALASARDRLAGAIYCSADESGDARLFTRNLARICADLGVVFRYGTAVSGLTARGDAVTAAVTDRGALSADAFVLAAGSHSPIVARSIGVGLPIQPVKGYTVTVPIDGHQGAPAVGIIDEDERVAFARLGARLRLGGKAEFGGYDTAYRRRDFDAILATARELFPDGGDYAKPEYWACLRPMTPDGPPILGRGRHRNLYFNTGHGAMGWTLACGSGRVTADLVAGRDPDIDLDGLTIDRF